MKTGRSYLDRSARRALAIVFACLFTFQAAGFFHAAVAMSAPSQTRGLAEAVDGIAAASEHCARFAPDGAPAGGQCDHPGFCAFCFAGDRDASFTGAPPPSSLIGVLAPEDEASSRFARSIELSAPLPSSSGLDVSRLATAPPRA